MAILSKDEFKETNKGIRKYSNDNNVNIINKKTKIATKKDIGNTLGFLGTKAASGFTDAYEGLADFGALLLKGVGKATSWAVNNPIGEAFFGKEGGDYKNNPIYQLGERMTEDDIAGTISNIADEEFSQKSYVKQGGIAEQIATGIGQVGGLATASSFLGSIKTPTLKGSGKTVEIFNKASKLLTQPTTQTMFVSTSGNSYTKALKEGASEKEAIAYGLLSGAKETGSELMYGGLGGIFGKGALDEVAEKSISNLFKTKIGKSLARFGVTMTAEGLEEVVSDLAEPLLQRIYKSKEEITPNTFQNLTDSFVSGALTSGIFKGGQLTLNKVSDIKNKANTHIKDNTQQINTQNNTNIPATQQTTQEVVANKPQEQKKTTDTIKPIKVYHGSPNPNLTEFDVSKSGTNTKTEKGVIYFTDNKKFAEDFAYERIPTKSEFIETKGKFGKIYEAELDIKKPLNLTKLTEQDAKNISDIAINMGLIEMTPEEIIRLSKVPNGQILKGLLPYDKNKLKKLGYDGIIARASTGFGDNKIDAYEYGVFDNNQIKLNDKQSQQPTTTTQQTTQETKQRGVYSTALENQNIPVQQKTNLPSMIEQGKLSQSESDELNTLKTINEVMELTNEEQKRYDTLINKQKNEQNIIEKLKTKKQNDVVNKYNKTIDTNVRDITKKLNNVLAFDNIKQKDKFKKVLMDYASNNKKPTYDNIKKDIEDNFAEKIISTTNETLKNIKRDVRQYKIKIDDYLKRGITDYNNFRKSNFGKLVLSNDGQNINSVYDELSDRYPYVFDKDVINEVDQLNRLSDFMNEDITNVEKYNLSDDAVNEATGYIKAFLDNKKDLNELINNIEISSAEVRRESIKENRYLAQKYIQNTANWKDTPILKQRIQTMKRNLRDIVGSQSEEMYNEYFAPISQHNAESNKFINSYNERIKKLELNTNEAIATQMVGELKYNPDTQLKDSDVQDFIKSKNINIEKVNNAVETFRNVYDELITKINDTLRQYGLKEIDYRKGYFPHFIDQHGKTIIGKIAEKLGWKFNDGKLPTDIAGLTEMFSPNKKWTPFAQRRTGDLTEYNALKGFDNYIRGASNLIHHTGDIQKLNGLQNEIRYQHSDKGLQKDIDEIEGSKNLTEEEKQSIIDTRFENYNGDLANFVTNLKDYTDNLAGKKSSLDRGAESLTGRKIYNTIDNIMGRVSANMVGANLSSAITNFIPLTQAYSQISTPNMFKAMAQTISNQKRNDNFVNRSVYLTNRINETDKLYKTGLEKITDKAGILFKVVDNFTAETIVRGKYLDNIKKGMTEQKAMNNADEFAKDVMAGRNLGDKPTLFNAKTNKLLTAFQLEVNNQYQYMFKDLPNDMKQEGATKLILAFLKMFVGAWIYDQLAEKITGRKSAFSPIDIITETIDTVSNDNLDVYDKVGKVGKNLLDELPFLGGLLGGGRIPISAAFPEGAKVIESASNLFDATKEESTKRTSAKKLASELSKPLYYLVPPFGGGQTKKIIEGISMYTKDVSGSYTASGKLRFPVDKKALQVAQSVLFGQYASDNAKEYFKNGYAPLGEKQIQEYKDLGVDIKDYWEYRAGLSKQKSVEDKFDYISNANFTNEQKNILINNAVDRKESVDISNYKDYGSYDEFSYATDNPSDYKVSKQIATYDKYKKWTDEINFKKGLTSEDKKVTINYINSLPLTVSQKALFIKKYYSSYDAYNSDIVKYVNSKNISKFEKATILKSVGFKSYDDYLINYVNGEKLTKEEKLNKLKDMGFTIKNGKVYK